MCPYTCFVLAILVTGLYCRTIYQKLLLDKEGELKAEQEESLPVFVSMFEPAQNQAQSFGQTDVKEQRHSPSPSADSEGIDLPHSEEADPD